MTTPPAITTTSESLASTGTGAASNTIITILDASHATDAAANAETTSSLDLEPATNSPVIPVAGPVTVGEDNGTTRLPIQVPVAKKMVVCV